MSPGQGRRAQLFTDPGLCRFCGSPQSSVQTTCGKPACVKRALEESPPRQTEPLTWEEAADRLGRARAEVTEVAARLPRGAAHYGNDLRVVLRKLESLWHTAQEKKIHDQEASK